MTRALIPQYIAVEGGSKSSDDTSPHFSFVSAGLESAPRLQIANQTLQNALNSQAAILRQGSLGGPPLILSPRLQQLQVPTTMANGLLANGGPPPLINPADTQGLLYAQYGYADLSNYASLTSPLLADYQAHADAAGGLFAR